MFGNGMTDEQFNDRLETLAKSVEKTAKNVDEAAKMIRDAKIGEKKPSEYCSLSFETENLAMPEIHVGKE